MPNPTLKDVARVAGVSPISVSRTLRDPGKVAPAMRERVLAAVRQTGYVPDGAASQLASGASRLIGVIVPTLEAPYFVDALRGLADVADAAGVSVTIGQTSYSLERTETLIRAMLAARPRGIALFGPDLTGPSRDMLVRAEIPIVEGWDRIEDPVGLGLGFSHEDAVFQLTKRLIEAGRRSIIFGARDARQSRAVKRLAGYRRALKDAGLPETLIAQEGPSAFAAGAAVAAAVMEKGLLCDALVCAADNVAAGAIAEFARHGRRVPDDVAVTGFGDLDFSSVLSPTITTVRVHNRDMGRLAGEFILAADWRLRLSREPRFIDLGYEIVSRASAPL